MATFSATHMGVTRTGTIRRRVLAAVVVIALVCLVVVMWTPASQAAAAVAFRATLIEQGPALTLLPGATTSYSMRYRNTGLTTWQRGVADAQVTLGVRGDAKEFADLGIAVNWLSPNRIARTLEAVVPPGGIGTFAFSVRAPTTPGAYTVPLRLVVDGLTWLSNDGVALTLTSDLGFHSQWLAQSAYPTLHPTQISSPLTVSFRNSGSKAWVRAVTAQQAKLGIYRDDKSLSSLAYGWPAADRVAIQTEGNVGPAATGTFTFRVRAPSSTGKYLLHLRPVIDGVTWMEDDGVLMFVTVVPVGAPLTTATPVPPSSSPSSAPPSATTPVTPSPAQTLPPTFTPPPTTFTPPPTTFTPPPPSSTPTPTTSAPPTQSATPTPTQTSTLTPTPTPVATPTPTPVATPTPTPVATPTPTPGPSFTTGASTVPSSLAAGGTVAINVSVTSAAATSALVDVAVYAPDGATVVYQTWFDNQTFATGQQRSYPVSWQVPASAVGGTYSVSIGIFSPGWVTLYKWQDRVATFTVTSVAPTPTPTPAPTPTPGPSGTPGPTPAPGTLSLRVQGNKLVGSSGQPVQLHGVNRSGTEYACIQGWGIFDGPSDAASVQAMRSWNVNSVRVPLNEDCWLGINGVSAAYGGANYRTAIVNFVNLLHQYGMYAEITLMWTAPGTQQATSNPQMPDKDHAADAWRSIATTFKNDPAVIFGTLNEPHDVGWSCWLNGGSACSLGYAVSGFQELVTAIRSTGATQPITIGGISYANDLSQWLAFKPADPLNSLVAEAHIYGKNACQDVTCWNAQIAPVNLQVPVLIAEFGETYDATECGSSLVSSLLTWADAHGIGYEAWVWAVWGHCLSLISDYNGTVYPAAADQYVKQHYATLASTPTPTPTASPTPTPGGTVASVISRGVPAFASNAIWPASNGNDAAYSSEFRAAPTTYLAYDLSAVPAAQRGRVDVSWYNEDTGQYDYTVIGDLAYNEPRDYTIDVNAAPGGGGSAPATGWVTLASVSGNLYHSREHVVDMSGYTWIRMRVTAVNGSSQNTDAGFNLDVQTAAAGAPNSWIFYGDSITAGAMGHGSAATFAQQVNAANPAYFPAQENGGIGYLLSADGASHINGWLATFPGKFVGIAYGTNDAGGGVSPATYYGNMDAMVRAVIAAGKTPMVPKIPYGCTGSLQANVPGLNAQIDLLYASYPQIVRGPDLYTYFRNNSSLLSSDCIHPSTPNGMNAYRTQMANGLAQYGP